MEGLSVLGGLMKGFATGKQQQLDREKQKEENELKKQLMKMQIEGQKTTLLQHQMKSKLLEALLPQLAGQQQGATAGEPPTATSTPTTPEFGESFRSEMPQSPQTGQKAGLTDTMSMMEMFRNPQTLALLKMADIDLVDIARMDQTQQQNLMTNLLKVKQMNQSAGQFDRSQAQSESQFQRGQALTGSAVTPQTVTLPDGSPGIIPFRTHGGGGAPQLGAQPGTGLPGGVTQTGPPQIEPYEFNEPSTGARMQGFRNKVTKEVLPNVKPIELEAPKGPAVEAAGKIAMAANAVNYFDQVAGMVISDIKRDESGKIVGGKINRPLLLKSVSWPMEGIGEGRTMNSKFRDAMDARIRAATGAAINASEIPYYESVYKPSIMDPDSLIFDKLNRAQEFLHGYLQTLDPAGRTRARMGTSSARFENNGKIYNIPKDMQGAFLKDNPDAKQVN